MGRPLRNNVTEALHQAEELSRKREQICKHPPICPLCRSKQVQLVDWVSDRCRSLWKCRVCAHPFWTKNK